MSGETEPGGPRVVFALVRHGHYEQPEGVPSAHLPHPLTARGQAQAEAAVEVLQMHASELRVGIHPELFASPLLRAWQSAQIIADGLSAVGRFGVREVPALCERALGAAANLRVDEIEQVLARDPRYPAPPRGWKSSSHFRLPFEGAESMAEAGARVASWLEEAAYTLSGPSAPAPVGAPDGARAGARLVIVLGHGAAFRYAAVTLGMLEADEVAGLSMFHCRPVLCAPSPSGRWRRVAGEWKVRAGAPVD